MRLWGNDEMLPTFAERQKQLWLHLPFFFKWGFSMKTKVGYHFYRASNRHDGLGRRELHFVILGLGLSYTENWDE